MQLPPSRFRILPVIKNFDENFDHIASAPKEELHQFLIGLYGEHILPATLHEIERLLHNDMYSMGVDAKGNQKYLITNEIGAVRPAE